MTKIDAANEDGARTGESLRGNSRWILLTILSPLAGLQFFLVFAVWHVFYSPNDQWIAPEVVGRVVIPGDDRFRLKSVEVVLILGDGDRPRALAMNDDGLFYSSPKIGRVNGVLLEGANQARLVISGPGLKAFEYDVSIWHGDRIPARSPQTDYFLVQLPSDTAGDEVTCEHLRLEDGSKFHLPEWAEPLERFRRERTR